MKTEQLRDELALVLKPYTNILMRERAAQAVIDHLAPMMRKMAEALEAIKRADTSHLFVIDFETGEEGRVAGLVPKELAQKALASIPEEWRK